MGLGEERKLQQTLATLLDEHRALDAMITGAKTADQLQLQRLKKRKLWLKDEIARLQAMLYEDIIA